MTLPLKWLHALLLGLLLLATGTAQAGSYDDFFIAIKRDNPSTIQDLLNRGFDANTLDPTGQPGVVLALSEESFKVLAVLLKWPQINVEARNRKDESALMLAALKGLQPLCERLIAQGADVNKPGWAPLHYAATHGHLAVMRLLLDENAYIDAASPNATTPLMMAAHYGTPEAVKLLLEAGADPMLKNAQGLSALDFAQRGNRPDAVKIIAEFIKGLQPKETW